MCGIEMKVQDLIELYQLCRIYQATYNGEGGDAAARLMLEISAEYRRRSGGEEISKARNPREAGRKRKYTEETNQKIQELHREGLSKRKIAKEIGCSLGHVQDVIDG